MAARGNIDDNFFGSEINGNFYSVKNITLAGEYQSLFGVAVGLRLKNISFENILFTAEAQQAAGIAHIFGQHTGNGNVYSSEISNVALDLVFEAVSGTGISRLNYGMNIHDAFIRMRRAKTSTVAEYPDVEIATGYEGQTTMTKAFMGVSRMAYNWGYGSIFNV